MNLSSPEEGFVPVVGCGALLHPGARKRVLDAPTLYPGATMPGEIVGHRRLFNIAPPGYSPSF